MNFNRTGVMSNYAEPIVTQDNLQLGGVIKTLSYEHDDQTVVKLMRDFCLRSSSTDIRKKGMELLYMNGYYTDLQTLINKNKGSTNLSSQRWSVVYQLLLDRKKGRCTPLELLEKANYIKTDEPELKCLIGFIKIMSHYDLGKYSNIGNFLHKQYSLIEDVQDNLLVSFFNIRLYNLLFIYYLVRNELIMARKYAFRILNQSKSGRIKANVNILLGFSYLFDTYYQGMYHLTESLKLSERYQLKRKVELIKQRNIPFFSAHFNRIDGIKTDDLGEQAHIEIAKGNLSKAKSILKATPINGPFKLYYLGIAEQDKQLLLKSYNYFIKKRDDYFFSRLPLNALRKMDG